MLFGNKAKHSNIWQIFAHPLEISGMSREFNFIKNNYFTYFAIIILVVINITNVFVNKNGLITQNYVVTTLECSNKDTQLRIMLETKKLS